MGGTKKKVGKARRDKYYHLAKESGFRARSAFKLIQLNRKFNFLASARVCLDLCAAPGGWMQVAVQHMPLSSLIIGVDLVPIKPIRGCIGIQSDITTEHCRQSLKKEMKHMKADVVLHDGAPNVGTSWVQDAHTQARLVLMSLKLAVEFLVEGGTFVTKVFRSRDYQALMWVFQQLFKKVQATKPQSSRDVSAEIFVVCRGYLAPAKLDPKMLDARYVFQEIDEPVKPTDIFVESKKKKKAEGYEDGNYTQYKTVNVMEFIQSDNYLDMLALYSAFTFEPDSELLKLKSTTEEIKTLLEDLKVLGKKDFKTLLKWRLEIREMLEAREKAKNPQPEPESDEESEKELNDEELLEYALAEGIQLEEARKRRLKKTKHKNEAKRRKRLAAQISGDISELVQDDSLFDLNRIKKRAVLDELDAGQWDDELNEDALDFLGRKEDFTTRPDTDDESSSEDENDYVDVLDAQLESQYDQYRERKGMKIKRVKLAHKTTHVAAPIPGLREEDGDDDADNLDRVLPDPVALGSDEEEDDDAAVDKAGSNPLLTKKEANASRRAALWFAQDQFAGLEDDDEDDEDAEDASGADDDEDDDGQTHVNGTNDAEAMSDVDADDVTGLRATNGAAGADFNDGHSSEGEGEGNGIEVVSLDAPTRARGSNLDAAGLALAADMISRKRKRQMIDEAYNRYTRNDAELPAWFADEESYHMQPNQPITKEMAEEIRARTRAIDARPVKRVLEAKGRKRMKLNKKTERAKSTAAAIADNPNLTEREKAQQIEQLYKKLHRKPKVEREYVVAKKSGAAKRAARPAGVKGVYRMVDPRMKTDKRAMQALEKRRGKKKRRGGK
eukprot:m.294326 g.294326  ORF g.294326 m.294326 type:complete len:841 (-) comp12970_c0_seq1:60-2582(-)